MGNTYIEDILYIHKSYFWYDQLSDQRYVSDLQRAQLVREFFWLTKRLESCAS